MSLGAISCIVPVWNGERYLAEALDSALAQTHPADEIIVVDDGSTDASADVVRSYGSRARYVHQRNAGSAAARNRGVAESRGELVSFLDQDDLWDRRKLERQVLHFQARPSTDVCVGHVELFWIPELAHEGGAYRGQPRGHRVPGYTAPAMLARRAAFDRVGRFDEGLSFGDATDWFLRAIDLGLDIALLPEVLLYHRMHASNLTRWRDSSKREFVHIVKATLDRRRRAATCGREPRG